MLMGRILTLSNREGFCFASDRFLAKEFGVTERHIRREIGVLCKSGFATKAVARNGRGKGTTRKVYPVWPKTPTPEQHSLTADIPDTTPLTADISGPLERTPVSGVLVTTEESKAHGAETKHILGWWIDQQSVEPTKGDIARQGAVAKRIAGKQTPEQIGFALAGIQLIPPCSLGTPPDCFLLERHFTTAVEAGARKNGHRKGRKDGWIEHGEYVDAQSLGEIYR
jgi:hypothetical protein